jgi:hypothetical protein
MVAWMPSICGDQSRTRTERTCQNVASRGDDLYEPVVEHPAIFVGEGEESRDPFLVDNAERECFRRGCERRDGDSV